MRCSGSPATSCGPRQPPSTPFRPVLALSEAELSRLEHELTVVPGRPSLVITVVAIRLTAVTFVLDPVASGVAGLAGPVAVALFALQAFNVSITFLLIYQLLRQTREVRRTVERSAVVDLFQPGPLHAFSRLTSRSGIAIVLLAASAVAVIPP